MESYNYISPVKHLKKMAIERILIEMIQDIKKGNITKEKREIPFLFLILDEYTTKIISSFVTVSDVLNYGIFSIEKLENKRKKFPNYQAIYFISPIKSSVELILNDFKVKYDPQYKKIHIIFSQHSMDSTLNILADERIYPRILTCKELNLSFICKNKNLFEFEIKNFLDIFSYKNDKYKEKDLISTLSDKLFCVCSVLREYPFIQYQKSSNFCQDLAIVLNIKLNNFYSSSDGNISNITRGLLLLTDRTLDVCTPLLHDYSYESLIFDIIEPEKLVIKTDIDHNITKKVEFDDNSELWNKYKNFHIAEVFEKVSNEFKDFYDKDYKRNQRNKYKDFDEMRYALRDAKFIKHKSEIFAFHFDICGKMIKVFLFFYHKHKYRKFKR